MINIREKVRINGLNQTIHIKGKSKKNPILLFLHGGPGVPNRHFIMNANNDLLDDFTIVGWDQRGVAGSYRGTDHSKLTIDMIVEDANALISYLCEKFNKEKVFVIGGSWGSLLGVKLAYKHPEKLYAFVGFGQFVDGNKNEELSYDFALEEAIKHNDEEAIKILRNIGRPVNGVYKEPFNGMMSQRNIMMKYGGYSKQDNKQSYWDAMVVPVLKSGEYSIVDIYGYIKGYRKVLEVMWPEVARVDLLADCPELKIPFFIFDGRLDNNTPASLVEEFVKNIKAPLKELHWFESSGHNPLADEPEKFKSLLKKKLLPLCDEATLEVVRKENVNCSIANLPLMIYFKVVGVRKTSLVVLVDNKSGYKMNYYDAYKLYKKINDEFVLVDEFLGSKVEELDDLRTAHLLLKLNNKLTEGYYKLETNDMTDYFELKK